MRTLRGGWKHGKENSDLDGVVKKQSVKGLPMVFWERGNVLVNLWNLAGWVSRQNDRNSIFFEL